MKDTDGDFTSYAAESARHKLVPRCPFASVERCPKYFEAMAVLGGVGVTAGLSAAEKDRLEKKWKGWHSPMLEHASAAFGSGDRLSFTHLCPEIGYDVFGHFATAFYRYADSLDAELAHERLSRDGVPTTDSRWRWSRIEPEHYTQCRVYSTLAAAARLDSTATAKARKSRIPPSLRWAILARDNYTCTYCGKKAPDVVLEVDHKISEADGGGTEEANLVTACHECNRGKGPRSA